MGALSRNGSFWFRSSLLLSSLAIFAFFPVVQAGGGGGLAGRHWYVEHISAMPEWALPASFLILLPIIRTSDPSSWAAIAARKPAPPDPITSTLQALVL